MGAGLIYGNCLPTAGAPVPGAPAVRCEATLYIAAINEWLRPDFFIRLDGLYDGGHSAD